MAGNATKTIDATQSAIVIRRTFAMMLVPVFVPRSAVVTIFAAIIAL
jgi:hypothetical protein